MRLGKHHIALILAVALGAAAGGTFLLVAKPPPAQPAAAQPPSRPAVIDPGPLPRLEATDCWFAIPSGRAARCGNLVVAERADAARPRALRLRFVVFAASAPTPSAVPLVYITGGPGEPAQIDAISIGKWWTWTARAPWLAGRDLIVFDPRGVGTSEPALSCPELSAVGDRIFRTAPDEAAETALWQGAARSCYSRLAESGLDLGAYNTHAIADDLRALLHALGYQSWDLYAVSYGTRVALEFLRSGAEGTRSLVLDSLLPVEATTYADAARNAARAFRALFRECAEEAPCAAAYPQLAASFERVVRRAAATPLELTLNDPKSGAPVAVRLDDARLVEALFYGLYEWRTTQRLPAVIDALDHGDLAPFLPLAAAAFATYASEKQSHGLYLSVECHDEYPFDGRDGVVRAAAETPLFRGFALISLPLLACPSWPSGSAPPASRDPVASDLPILILAGDLDPVASPDAAAAAPRLLSHARVLRFRGVGHGVVAAHACADRLLGHFLEDPSRTPYDDCLLALAAPHFVIDSAVP
jgi:pimeloyl-ACP methyl ester carboxylesterase